MQKNGKIVKCEICGKEFYLCSCRLKKRKEHFCSKKCYGMYKRSHKKENILSPYRLITRNGKHTSEHRYVMEQYLGRELERNEYVHHKNGDKHDNRLENLEVMTPLAHNREHQEKLPKIKICVECGKQFEPPIKHRGRNILCSKECWTRFMEKISLQKSKKIASYKDGVKIKEYSSIKEASLELNGSSTNIVKCLKGKTKSAYGYQWKYIL